MGVGHQSSRQAFNVRAQLSCHLNLYSPQQLLCDPSSQPGCLLWIRVQVRWKRTFINFWSLTVSLQSKQTRSTVVQLLKHNFSSSKQNYMPVSMQRGCWQEGSVDKKREPTTKPDNLSLIPRTYITTWKELTQSCLLTSMHSTPPPHKLNTFYFPIPPGDPLL